MLSSAGLLVSDMYNNTLQSGFTDMLLVKMPYGLDHTPGGNTISARTVVSDPTTDLYCEKTLEYCSMTLTWELREGI